jgi:hypothetical protein
LASWHAWVLIGEPTRPSMRIAIRRLVHDAGQDH